MRKNILLSYIDRFRHDHRKRMMLGSVLCFLGIIVALTVYWQLRGTGISMTNETFCGLEEHTHTDDCYEYVLVCGYDDNTLETTDTSEAAGTSEATSTSESTDASEASNSTEAHVHTDDCYELQLVCGLEEHIHTAACLIDLTADVEDASVWKATLPELTGSLRTDIVSIARSQLGYTESSANYELGEDESTHYGYTRYGAWYGNEYGDWDGMFAAFCLNYAGIDEDEFPLYSGAYAWGIALGDLGEYADAADYTPVAGDLVFFDTDGDGRADRVGIVAEVDENAAGEGVDDDSTDDAAADDKTTEDDIAADNTVGTIIIIEGNYTIDETDCVCENTYSLTDESIIGYGVVPEQDTDEESEDNVSEEEVSEDGTSENDSDTDTTTLEYIGDDYIVTVTYGEDAELPENVTLWVYEYLQESGTYIARYAEAAELYGWDEDGSDDSDGNDDSDDAVDSDDSEDETDDEDTCDTTDIRLFNISFVDESGNEIEPATTVQVTVMYLDQETEYDSYTVTHFGENGTETIEVETKYEDGTQTISFGLESFSEIMLTAGFNPGQSGGNASDAIYVQYDRVTVSGTTLTAQNDTVGIESVKLDGSDVPHADGSSRNYSNSTTGLKIEKPYETSGRTVSITVTPADGYYITLISVNCCQSGSATSCQTYKNGDAYESSFTVSSSGAITVNVTLDSEQGFHHANATNYFILIAVSTVPSPLYVEYDYGDIVTYITNNSATNDSSAFSTTTGWTTTSDVNYYGNGISDSNADKDYTNGSYTGYGVMTDDTQYKYAYTSGSETEAAKWMHYANTITDEARAQAAAAGYVFAGWKAEYYTSVSVASNSSGYNNWTYTFSSSYGESTYSEGDQVTLTTNVRMVAQWIPIGVTVTKTVEGLSGTEYENESHTYKLQLQVQGTDANNTETWTDYGDPISFSITGDGTASTIIYPLPAGTYRVVETDGNGNLTSKIAIYYITVDTGGNVTVSYSSYTETEVTDSTSSTGKTTVALLNEILSVTNSYTDTPRTVTVILKKTDNDTPANALSGAVFTLTDSTTNSTNTLAATDSDGTATIGTLTVGSSYTLTETTAPDGYSLLADSIIFTVDSANQVTIISGYDATTATTYTADSDGNITITVVNTTSPVMPSTGGGGDGRFHLFGMSLILLAILGLCGYKNISETKMALADGADESIYRPPRKGRSPDKRKRKAILREMPKRGESRAGPDG